MPDRLETSAPGRTPERSSPIVPERGAPIVPERGARSTLQPGAASHVLLAAFVDELARCGMEAACTSPGSRCTPIVLALARDSRIRCHSHIDERSSAFFALGLAKASGLPVAVTCTSGTAAAELLPAAIEAREARVPLLLLTADRPPELREVGAGQTIDQLKLFGAAAKWFFEVGVDRAEEPQLRWMRTLACRAYWMAAESPQGVVHLNFPLREPLLPDATVEQALIEDRTARGDSTPYLTRPRERGSPHDIEGRLGHMIETAERGLIVAGRHERSRTPGTGLPCAAAAFAERRGWPLLADPLSWARRGEGAIAHYDALLRNAAFTSRLRPDLVLRIGDLPTSKPLRSWLAGMPEVPQVLFDPEGAFQDPASVAVLSIASDPELALRQLPGGQERDWLASWRSADAVAAEALGGVLAGGQLSEPALAQELGVLLPEQATLFVASSMPVRDIESFWPVRSDPPRVLCNRGANGIDGTVSSALGAAAADLGPVVLLIGDVALAHDVGALICSGRLEVKLTIVLINNEGGGIFDFLPVSGAAVARERDGSDAGASTSEDIYTRHIATPPHLDFEALAALCGLRYERADTVAQLRQALEHALGSHRSNLIEVRTDRAANVALHARAWGAVAAALHDAA